MVGATQGQGELMPFDPLYGYNGPKGINTGGHTHSIAYLGIRTLGNTHHTHQATYRGIIGVGIDTASCSARSVEVLILLVDHHG